MDEFQGPVISKLTGQLGRRSPGTDSVFGLLIGGVAAAGLALGVAARLSQLTDAEALGLNAAYDANNNVLVHHHIERYFAYHPDGTLWVQLVAQGTSMAAMCEVAGSSPLRQLLTAEAVRGGIRKVGVVLNPAAAPAAGAYANGLLADALAAIPKAQALLDELAATALYTDNVLLEGLVSAAATPTALPDLRTLASECVSVCVAADPAVLAATGRPYADVGSALGMLSVRKVSECLGSVDVARRPATARPADTYPLTNTGRGYWLGAALSGGQPVARLSAADRSNLGAKGYLYAGSFRGLDGVFFNDSHTCTAASDDYAYIEDTGVWNKAARLLRAGLLPLFRGEVEVDDATGYLSAGQVAYYQSKGARAVRPMSADKEISGDPVVVIEPRQDVVGTGVVRLGLGYVRRGILRRLEAAVGAFNPAGN